MVAMRALRKISARVSLALFAGACFLAMSSSAFAAAKGGGCGGGGGGGMKGILGGDLLDAGVANKPLILMVALAALVARAVRAHDGDVLREDRGGPVDRASGHRHPADPADAGHHRPRHHPHRLHHDAGGARGVPLGREVMLDAVRTQGRVRRLHGRSDRRNRRESQAPAAPVPHQARAPQRPRHVLQARLEDAPAARPRRRSPTRTSRSSCPPSSSASSRRPSR